MPRGRKAADVPVKDLQKAITEVEEANKFDTQKALWEAVADTDWAKSFKPPLTFSVISSRVRQNKLTVATPPGKKGGGGFKPGMSRGVKKSGAERMIPFADSLKAIEDVTPARFSSLMEKVKAGSRSAAMNLKCLDCVAFQTKEVKLCPSTNCPLWPFRPYQNGSGVVQIEGGGDDEIEERG